MKELVWGVHRAWCIRTAYSHGVGIYRAVGEPTVVRRVAVSGLKGGHAALLFPAPNVDGTYFAVAGSTGSGVPSQLPAPNTDAEASQFPAPNADAERRSFRAQTLTLSVAVSGPKR